MKIIQHVPVLPIQILNLLQPRLHKRYVDMTFGMGGHSRLLLRHRASVIGLDRDVDAYQVGEKFMYVYQDNITRFFDMYHDKFSCVEKYVDEKVDGVLIDAGASTVQLKTKFSVYQTCDLHMQMGCNKISAYEVVNAFNEDRLAKIIYDYGEEHSSRKIAKMIVQRRHIRPFTTTTDLAEHIRKYCRNSNHKIHPATKTFQALRIYINDELNELRYGLYAAMRLLKLGGILVVISFHSLEDRIVKQFCKQHNCKRKPIIADSNEFHHNRNSRSAKLRWIRKL